jgi:hypothetical protein
MTLTPVLLVLFGFDAEPMCFSSDVQALCCPSACAAKASPRWPEANDVLRGCMRGLGCRTGVDSATVGMRCNCPSSGKK